MLKFEQLKRLYSTMREEYKEYSNKNIYISAITSDFDRLFELSWKTLKEYMDKVLYIPAARTGSPRDIIKLAYKEGFIDDEEFWIKILMDRNDDAHHYNESAARGYASRIYRDYMNVMGRFIDNISKLISEEKDILKTVPYDFIKACDNSGMYYDEFLTKVMNDNACSSELELFDKWDMIKNNYI